MHGFNELLTGFPGVLCSRQETHKERKILTFDFTPVAIDTTTCFALSCLRGLNVEWPSDIFNPLYAKDAFPFSVSHRNVSVGKFRHSLLTGLDSCTCITLHHLPFFNQCPLDGFVLPSKKSKILQSVLAPCENIGKKISCSVLDLQSPKAFSLGSGLAPKGMLCCVSEQSSEGCLGLHLLTLVSAGVPWVLQSLSSFPSLLECGISCLYSTF